MKLKDAIINEFYSSKNCYSVWNTTPEEIGNLYDLMVECLSSNKNWNQFLAEQKAITLTDFGYSVNYDRMLAESKTKMVFKYPVFNHLKKRYLEAVERINGVDQVAIRKKLDTIKEKLFNDNFRIR